MNEIQIKFIVDHFFRSHHVIANELVKMGKLIVAGDGNLWSGGVGNFIKKKPAPGSIGCTLLIFDKDEFLKSLYFKEYKREFIEQKMEKIKIEMLAVDMVSAL